MRTDGNEFLVYLVGYDERQIASYIRRLYKEFKNMPYDYNAIIGYSMITDDLKSIEDAINEAVDDMKNKKQDLQE
jgi:GGDEF domain-containing protein